MLEYKVRPFSGIHVDRRDRRGGSKWHLEPRTNLLHLIMLNDQITSSKQASHLQPALARGALAPSPFLKSRHTHPNKPGYVAPGEAVVRELSQHLTNGGFAPIVGAQSPLNEICLLVKIFGFLIQVTHLTARIPYIFGQNAHRGMGY